MHLMRHPQTEQRREELPQVVRAGARPQVVSAAGYTLLVSEESSPQEARVALKSLRGFRATRRRIVWCDVTQLQHEPNADMATWGRRLVENGRADAVIVSGDGARETAVGAREAGLALGRVVVCPNAATGRNVVSDLVGPGDTLLVLGVDREDCRRLVDRLDAKTDAQLQLSAVA